MQYLPPAKKFFDVISIEDNTRRVSMPREIFDLFMRWMTNELVDRQWYVENNPDVASAVTSGQVEDEATHFARSGFREGRRPRMFDVDASWYEETYPDVAEAIRRGEISGAHAHFNSVGYDEGRAPHKEALRIMTEWTSARTLADANTPARLVGQRPKVR